VSAGDVYRIRTTLTDPPKQKIVLHVGTATNLFLWFNTDARKRPAQMAVAQQEAPGITHNCYLDCGRVTTFPQRELDGAEHCGHASNAFLTRVIEEVETRATTLTRGQRNAIATALRESM
jgi:hypothetical protein